MEKQSTEHSAESLRVLSPPVVQNPTETAFSVTWMVSALSSGLVEWGSTAALGNKSISSRHGLINLSEYALSVRIENIPANSPIFYRVITTSIHYEDAYNIVRGEPIIGEIRQLKLPKADAKTCSLTIVNDTHEESETVSAMAERIEALNPDAHIWNGDTCNNFHGPQQIARLCLGPGQQKDKPGAGGWASTRPLLFSPGNHDIRGRYARLLPEIISPWPMKTDDPMALATAADSQSRYYFAKRIGPVAIIVLNTGEDKPDQRDVFSGTANYQPYREAQRAWLSTVLTQPEIAHAPYLIAFCHIPLIGLAQDNDGMGETGYAKFSGDGQRLWLPALIEAGCQMIISGHTHRQRIDSPTKAQPIYQVVGGGPTIAEACLLHLQADNKSLTLTIENLTLSSRNLSW